LVLSLIPIEPLQMHGTRLKNEYEAISVHRCKIGLTLYSAEAIIVPHRII